jgi:hypothetical protein
VLLVSVALLAAGCSSGTKVAATSKPAAGTTTTTAGNGGGAAFQAYRDCLKQHGIDLPAGTGRGFGGQSPDGTPPPTGSTPRTPRSLPPGVDQQTFDAAQTACADKRPAGGFRGFGGGANAAAFAAYASCMKDHGVTIPTRGAGGGTTTSVPQAPPPTVDRSSPQFQAANQICSALLPQPGANGGPGSTSTTIPAT